MNEPTAPHHTAPAHSVTRRAPHLVRRFRVAYIRLDLPCATTTWLCPTDRPTHPRPAPQLSPTRPLSRRTVRVELHLQGDPAALFSARAQRTPVGPRRRMCIHSARAGYLHTLSGYQWRAALIDVLPSFAHRVSRPPSTYVCKGADYAAPLLVLPRRAVPCRAGRSTSRPAASPARG